MIQPRDPVPVGADVILLTEGPPERAVARTLGQCVVILPGSLSGACWKWGFPGNVGDPVVSVERTAKGEPDPNPPGPRHEDPAAGGSEEVGTGGTAE